MVKPQTSPKSRPRVSRNVNDNYCVLNVARVKNSVHVSGKKQVLNPSPVIKKSETVVLHVNSFAANVHSVTGLPQKKGVNPNYCCTHTEIKPVNDVSCEFCNFCHKCPNCCHTSTCRGKASAVLGKMGSSGFESKGSHNTKRGLHPSLPVQTQPNQVTNGHKQICQPTKTVPPFGGTVSADKPKCSRTGRKPKLTGILQLAIFGAQTQQPVETHPGPEHPKHLPKHRVVQNGDTKDNKDLPSVTSIDFKDAYFHVPIHSQSRKYMRFHIQGQSYQFKALPFGLSTAPMEFTVAKEVKLMALQKGIRIHQYLDDWFMESHIPPGKVRTGSKTGLQLRRLPVRPQGGQGQTHTRALADLNRQDTVNPIQSSVHSQAVHVPYSPSNSHRKTSPPGETSYEAHTVALEKTTGGYQSHWKR